MHKIMQIEVKSFSFSISIKHQKGALSDLDHGWVVGARWAGVNISKTADLLGFSHISVYKEQCGKKHQCESVLQAKTPC